MTVEQKLERLIRHHRQRVFDEGGERHTRAILRLKATPTAKRVYAGYEASDRYRVSERLLRLYA